MRDSNIELLRIIATILIIVVHAGFFALSAPTANDLSNSFNTSLIRITIESIAICAVNVFVFISGWYGIKPKLKSIANLSFQILYFTFGIYVFCLIFGYAELKFGGILSIFCLTQNGWFIRAYIGLLILVPILNLYIDNAPQKQFKFLLITFFIFQTIYGWWFGVAAFFVNGYSTLSFVGIYMLARYLNIYHKYNTIQYNTIQYIACVLTLTIIVALLIHYGQNSYITILYAYNNPIIILMAISLFMIFKYFKINSPIVNNIAQSSFAIYLLHTNQNIMQKFFVAPLQNIFTQHDGFACFIYISLIIICFIISALILDIPRRLIWIKFIVPAINKYHK